MEVQREVDCMDTAIDTFGTATDLLESQLSGYIVSQHAVLADIDCLLKTFFDTYARTHVRQALTHLDRDAQIQRLKYGTGFQLQYSLEHRK
jgi:hypothetical protein